MSATCSHADDEAYQHADCHGCVTLMLQQAEAGVATRSAERAQWKRRPTSADVIADARRQLDMHRYGYSVEEVRTARCGELPLDLAELRAARESGMTLLQYARATDPIRGRAAEFLVVDDPHANAVTDPEHRRAVMHWYTSRTPTRPSLLPDRPLTPEERAAHDEDPRPGVWAGEGGADLRALTQEETDTLIRIDVLRCAGFDDYMDVLASVGLAGHETTGRELPGQFGMGIALADGVRATRQRGGIDSDPLVRLLAYRAWGDRDRQWFELRGVRKGDEVEHVRMTNWDPPPPALAVAKTWHTTSWPAGIALSDARPGERVDVQWAINSTVTPRVVASIVSDRLRDDPDEVEIIATPATSPGDRVQIHGVVHAVVRVEHTENGSRAWCRPYTVGGGGALVQMRGFAYGVAVTTEIRRLLAAGMPPDEVVRFVTQRSTMLTEDVIRLVAAAM